MLVWVSEKSLNFCIFPRYDFVLHANRTDASTFIMRFAGLFDCASLGVRAAAVLRYKDDDDGDGDANGDADGDADDGYSAEEEERELIKILLSSEYEDFLDREGPVLNALNYAPPTEKEVAV